MSHTLDSITHGDCLEILAQWPAESFDLAYLDPPFNTGRTHTAQASAFSDAWSSLHGYLEFLAARVREVYRVLKPHGSILLHCDWRTSHHVRLMLDEIFGVDGFVNHLIWSYGLGGSSPRRFARKHDDILFYAKSSEYYFDPPMIPASSNRMKGRLKKASDVLDVPSINNMSNERVGYPTQKPLALLQLLVGACAPLRGVVLDPFCGSGTTLVAAAQTERRFVGIDVNPQAIDIARRRCAADAARTVTA